MTSASVTPATVTTGQLEQDAGRTLTSQSGLTPERKTLEDKLPKQFLCILQPGDREWIAHCLYDSTGKLRDSFLHNWFYPPEPRVSAVTPPDPHSYFRQRLFVWTPMRMWGIPLKCPTCDMRLNHGGLYRKAREVVDIDSRYYLIGEYLRCNRCKTPQCPWNSALLSQLDAGHRSIFPAVLTTKLAIDRKCLTLLKRRSAGNSSSSPRAALSEIHSEEWGRRVVQYLTACDLHRKGGRLAEISFTYAGPPSYRPLPLAQWFETAHSNEVLQHVDEMKGCITSTYGNVLKMDSTKKVLAILFLGYILK